MRRLRLLSRTLSLEGIGCVGGRGPRPEKLSISSWRMRSSCAASFDQNKIITAVPTSMAMDKICFVSRIILL